MPNASPSLVASAPSARARALAVRNDTVPPLAIAATSAREASLCIAIDDRDADLLARALRKLILHRQRHDHEKRERHEKQQQQRMPVMQQQQELLVNAGAPRTQTHCIALACGARAEQELAGKFLSSRLTPYCSRSICAPLRASAREHLRQALARQQSASIRLMIDVRRRECLQHRHQQRRSAHAM